jgi:N-acetylmuramate 1-kinase
VLKSHNLLVKATLVSGPDVRLDALRAWLDAQVGDSYALAPASADASFRRYFRVTTAEGTRIAMDAPPPREDCRPFVKVAALMHEAGVHAPQVLAQDIERGFLLLTDLGTTTYLSAIRADNADALFSDAIDTLIRWQLASRPEVLPPYDEALLRREMDLFPEWYVGRHLGVALSAELQRVLGEAMTRIVRANLAQPSVYVHRDYMPRNLMVSTPNPGVLDFQDAVYGPIAYDVVSLFRDAFLSWEEERVIDWTARYWERARHAGLPVNGDFGEFYRDFEWMGLQRHLKVLGIFARICYRDGKPDYLADTPRFIAYARAVCGRYGALSGLLRVFDALENRAPTYGYTF